jgi:lipoprotein-anchoring transpeptidase ErfK/SrfK
MRSTFVAAVLSVSLVVPGALRAAPMSDDIAARPVASADRRSDSPSKRRATPRPPVSAPVGQPIGTPTVGPSGTPGSTLTTERRAEARLAADSLVVEKSLRRLTLWQAGLPIRTYDIALGGSPVGAKQRAGDNKTPEGLYHIDARNPNSRFHLGLHVSYPNAQDVARARAQGVAPGGDIMLHGLPPKHSQVGPLHRAFDWTNGCVALTDAEIEEVFAAVPVGTPVRFLP